MHSIWLIPREPEFNTLQLLIARVAKFTGGPVFEPHVTVLANIPLNPSEVVNRSGPHFRNLPSFKLTAHEIGIGTSYFKSLFLRVEPSDILFRLHQLASRHLPSESSREDFEPHISLAYGSPNCSKCPQITEIAKDSIPMQLRCDEMAIVHASELIPVKEWRRREVIRLDLGPNR